MRIPLISPLRKRTCKLTTKAWAKWIQSHQVSKEVINEPQRIARNRRVQDKTVSQLVQRYEQVFEEECRSRNKQYLIRCIAWRLQANEEGGLSRAALKKAEELAIGAETRVTAPKKNSTEGVKLVLPEPDSFVDWDPRLPPPGNIVERQYKAR